MLVDDKGGEHEIVCKGNASAAATNWLLTERHGHRKQKAMSDDDRHQAFGPSPQQLADKKGFVYMESANYISTE